MVNVQYPASRGYISITVVIWIYQYNCGYLELKHLYPHQRNAMFEGITGNNTMYGLVYFLQYNRTSLSVGDASDSEPDSWDDFSVAESEKEHAGDGQSYEKLTSPKRGLQSPMSAGSSRSKLTAQKSQQSMRYDAGTVFVKTVLVVLLLFQSCTHVPSLLQ